MPVMSLSVLLGLFFPKKIAITIRDLENDFRKMVQFRGWETQL